MQADDVTAHLNQGLCQANGQDMAVLHVLQADTAQETPAEKQLVDATEMA